jgi:hypothetical protein
MVRPAAIAIVTLAALLAACGGEAASEEATASAAPRARLAAPLYAPLGVAVLLDAGASYDPDGTIVSYAFSFSDGEGQVTLSTSEASHVFTQEGAFEVAVVVRDDAGLLSRATQLVVVRDAPPSCDSAIDCSLGAECRTDLKLCYATGPGVGSGDAECQLDENCGDGLVCRAGICLRSGGGLATP